MGEAAVAEAAVAKAVAEAAVAETAAVAAAVAEAGPRLLDGGILALDPRARAGAPELVIAPGEDVRAHGGLGNLAVIGVAFPRFRDGRGYSSARILRERGFAGDVRAVGDVTLDQLLFLKRAGFSSVAPERPIDPAAAAVALARFPAFYQGGADGSVPAFALRHGTGSGRGPAGRNGTGHDGAAG